MMENNNIKPTNKYQPKGLTIIHEDRDIIVVDKISGLLTMASEKERIKTIWSARINPADIKRERMRINGYQLIG